MIYTITFNPAIDYMLDVNSFEICKINRANSEYILPGGKGINVSVILKNLDIPNISLGFIAGFTGDKIEEMLNNQGVKTDYIKLKEGFSRINVKVSSNGETAINGNGPRIFSEDLEKLFLKLERLQSGDTLILSGSIPSSLPDDIYETICTKLHDKNIDFVVDATKDLLVNSLKYNPFLVKPNRHELGEIFDVEIDNKEIAIKYAKKLQEKGAKNVLVSMGGMGAVLVDENRKEYFLEAPSGKRLNTVGAGDSMVAGFIAGYKIYNEYFKAFKMGVAAGTASACSKNLATKDEIINLFNNI